MMMDDKYQERSRRTAIYKDGETDCPPLGPFEAGEVYDKIKKVLRDKNGEFTQER